MSFGTGVLIAIGVIIVWLIAMYNKLIASRNGYENAFAQIDVQLTRRHDLIPNLVETAKGYMAHEKDTLEAVINARNQAVGDLSSAKSDPNNGDALKKLGVSENGLSAALGKLFALSEAYPDLKANENMMQLSEELTTTENKVAFARQAFNDGVMRYNILRESFPSNFVANFFQFKPASMLEIESEEMRKAPDVSF
ncbi:MAG: LemA family protein [Arenicella sp.]